MNRMELHRNRLLASLVAAGLLAGMITSALGAGYLDDLDIGRAQISEIKKGLTSAVRHAGAKNIGELRGRRAAEWAAKPLDR